MAMRTSLLLLLLTLCLSSFAQEQVIRLPDFPGDRYRGGSKSFFEHMGRNLIYPRGARDGGTVGMSILAFTLTSDARVVDIEIANSLSKDIDESILTVFSEVKDEFIATEDALPIRIYMPITYTIEGANVLRVPIKDDLFVEEITVKSFGFSRSTVIPRSKLIDRMFDSMEKGKHKKALRTVGQLIKRDPMNLDWYLKKISIYKEMSDPAGICQELTKIKELLQHPVNPELISEYCQ